MAARSLEELEHQIKTLQAEAEELRLAEGIEQLRAIIAKYKVGLRHFKIALEATKKRNSRPRKLSPAYRNPNDPSQTWTGRGRRPRWLVAALDAGNTVEQCRVGHSTMPDALSSHQVL
jgi:DNA-binding protein H-NS